MTIELIEANLANVVEEATVEMQQAKTPEEAYKILMAKFGAGMMQVVADSLAAVVANSSSSVASNQRIVGWQEFITGCNCVVDFGSPYTFGNANVSNTSINNPMLQYTKLHTTAHPKKPELLGGSVSISVGGSWSF